MALSQDSKTRSGRLSDMADVPALMGRTTSPIDVSSDTDDGLDDAPLAAGWVIEGDPKPRMKITSMSPGGEISGGVWCCQPSRFTFIYDVDEYIHIVAGRVTVVAGAHVHELSAGSTCLFPRGLVTEWTVHEPIRKVFVLNHGPRWKRILKRLAKR